MVKIILTIIIFIVSVAAFITAIVFGLRAYLRKRAETNDTYKDTVFLIKVSKNPGLYPGFFYEYLWDPIA